MPSPLYLELTVEDLIRAKAFYGAFGWEFVDYGPAYASIRYRGEELGGLAQGVPRPTGGPLVVLFS
ncbi:MAG: hypothetical protein KDA83_22515, partial [Planctomycetales bacterium]|nr:hypothetical protein [Planctomycetales bacterium]